jgi:hypothetical protein
MFRTVHDAVRLPDQEELLLRHTMVCSHANPPPSGKSSLCNGQYNDRRKRTIGIPSCGHEMHEQCLVNNFQVRDDSIGRCPVCDLALRERDLAECIETDREVWFPVNEAAYRGAYRVLKQKGGRLLVVRGSGCCYKATPRQRLH